MNLGDEVDLEDYVSRPDKISAAEVSNIYFLSLICIWELKMFCSLLYYAN